MKKLLFFVGLFMSTNNMYAQNYLFFLHNMWVELNGIEGAHSEYGRTEYKEMLQKFRKEGFTVISEQRPKGTNGNVYAIKVAKQIDSLLKKGVPASHITVVGTSKGGYIAMYTSSIVKNTDVNFVLIGCCGESSESDDSIHLYGNVLSIYEASDTYSSCQQTKNKQGSDVKRFKEIQLHTGLKHGFLYKASDDWIKPASEWARQHY